MATATVARCAAAVAFSCVVLLAPACRRAPVDFESDFRVLRDADTRSNGLPTEPRALKDLRARCRRAMMAAQDKFGEHPGTGDGAWRLGEVERIGSALGLGDPVDIRDRAEHHLRLALAHDPTETRAHVSLGFLYLSDGADAAPRAEQEFRQAIETTSVGSTSVGPASASKAAVDPEAYKGLFLSYYYQGRWADSLAPADLYLAERPGDEDFKKVRAMAASNATRGRETKT